MFHIDRKAKKFILVACGIGFAPMIAITHSMMAEGLRGFKLYYFSHDVAGTAFLGPSGWCRFASPVPVKVKLVALVRYVMSRARFCTEI